MCFVWFQYLTVPAILQGDVTGALTSLLGQASPNGFSDSCNHRWYDLAPGGTRNTDSNCVSRGHWPFCSAIERKVRTSPSLGSCVMDLGTQHGLLSPNRSGLFRVVSSQPVTAVKAVRPEVPPLLRDNLRFTLPHLLVLLDLFVLVNSVHELSHAGDWLPSEGLS